MIALFYRPLPHSYLKTFLLLFKNSYDEKEHFTNHCCRLGLGFSSPWQLPSGFSCGFVFSLCGWPPARWRSSPSPFLFVCLFIMMDSSFFPSWSAFPPLNSSSSTTPSLLGAPPIFSLQPFDQPTARCNWKDLFTSQTTSSKAINLSFIPCSDDEVVFTEEELSSGQKEWGLSLVGHAIGKRPFYRTLLAAIKKKWNFKGSLDLLTMEGDFFPIQILLFWGLRSGMELWPLFSEWQTFYFQKVV